jgi:uncharacterized DUF497 family protein
LVYEWDHSKAGANYRKHGVRFDEAVTVFNDPLAAVFADEDHSVSEAREVIVGYSLRRRLLIVSFTERENQRVRVISARLATRRETQAHENHSQ